MRHIVFTLSMCLAACGTSGPPNGFPVVAQNSPEYALMSGATLLDLRVTGGGQLSVVPEEGSGGASFMFFPAAINAHLTPTWRSLVDPNMQLALLYGTAEAPDVHQFPWDYGHGPITIQPGSRYLGIFAGGMRGRPEVPSLISLKRIDASGRLIDPALGYPVGTPISTVMNPSGISPSLLRDSDGGVPMDG